MMETECPVPIPKRSSRPSRSLSHDPVVDGALGARPGRHRRGAVPRGTLPPVLASALCVCQAAGHGVHDAQDLTQSFFARLLEKDWLLAADRAKGRFRSFLLMAMQRFLANEWDRSRARKRGGGETPLSIDWAAVESLSIPDPAAATRRWSTSGAGALTLLETVMCRLRAEHETAGKSREYEHLKPCLTAERGAIDYEALGSALGIGAASARSSVHRLRKRFRELFREEVAGTVADPAEVDDEVRAVIASLGAP